MYYVECPDKLFQVKFIRMLCNENGCWLKNYNPWRKQVAICPQNKEKLFIRRARIDKNGRKYCDPKCKPKCVLKILQNVFEGKDVPYASSEISHMNKLMGISLQ